MFSFFRTAQPHKVAKKFSDFGIGEDDERAFWARLNDTIAWCIDEGQVNNSNHSLRRLASSLVWDKSDTSIHSRRDQIAQFSRTRLQHLQKGEYQENSHPPKNLSGGRLLAYFPDSNLFDGYAESVTDGFFDVDNMPPCDTWVDFLPNGNVDRCWEDFLVSWVPQELVSLVDKGVQGNPEECIIWLDTYKHPIVDIMLEKNLLR